MRPVTTAGLLFIFLTLVTGVIYPAIVTLFGSLAFPVQAGGSLIRQPDGKLTGSSLIGQPFSDPKYFWPRPSATADFPYNSLASGGSNLGPTNPELLKKVGQRLKDLKAAGMSSPVPADLVMSSGSGLDPHISPAAALLQVPRVAQARHLGEEQLRQLVQDRLEDRQWGFLGAPRVNVLQLNLALDKISHGR